MRVRVCSLACKCVYVCVCLRLGFAESEASCIIYKLKLVHFIQLSSIGNPKGPPPSPLLKPYCQARNVHSHHSLTVKALLDFALQFLHSFKKALSKLSTVLWPIYIVHCMGMSKLLLVTNVICVIYVNVQSLLTRRRFFPYILHVLN